jgi:hypothetical protein
LLHSVTYCKDRSIFSVIYYIERGHRGYDETNPKVYQTTTDTINTEGTRGTEDTPRLAQKNEPRRLCYMALEPPTVPARPLPHKRTTLVLKQPLKRVCESRLYIGQSGGLAVGEGPPRELYSVIQVAKLLYILLYKYSIS